MPVSTLIVLAAIVAVFTIFASALAWAQLQTRHLAGAAARAKAVNSPKRRPF
jgi:uncharacterized membrane protein